MPDSTATRACSAAAEIGLQAIDLELEELHAIRVRAPVDAEVGLRASQARLGRGAGGPAQGAARGQDPGRGREQDDPLRAHALESAGLGSGLMPGAARRRPLVG